MLDVHYPNLLHWEAGSDPGKVMFLQVMLAAIWVEKVLGCGFWG